jgi:hypothetical protein
MEQDTIYRHPLREAVQGKNFVAAAVQIGDPMAGNAGITQFKRGLKLRATILQVRPWVGSGIEIRASHYQRQGGVGVDAVHYHSKVMRSVRAFTLYRNARLQRVS